MRTLSSLWRTSAIVLAILAATASLSCKRMTGQKQTHADRLEKALGLIKRGVIKDAKTIIALQAWKIKLLEKK